MKRIICLLTALCLVFGSFSFCFATPTQWDTSDSANLRYIYQTLTSGGSLYNLVNTISTTTNTISNNINTIKGYLIDDGHSVAYWASAIASWMNPIYTSITSIPLSLTQVENGLWWDLGNGNRTEYLRSLVKGLTNYGYLDPNESARYTAHQTLFTSGYNYQELGVSPNGQTFTSTWSWVNGSPLGNLALILTRNNSVMANTYAYRWAADLTGYNSLQSLVSFADPDSTVTFTPQSATDGIYKYLNAINTPLARLGYVLASDSRIEAQEAAAANEQAVVDNFIDSSGAGSASPSDIGSISDLSSGYQNNFGSDASVSGIFNIFNSNNMGWFSQETANQLDTTNVNRRGSSFETPLLDQQINDIYDQIGVKHD